MQGLREIAILFQCLLIIVLTMQSHIHHIIEYSWNFVLDLNLGYVCPPCRSCPGERVAGKPRDV